jgi:arylsulfatase A-like enzyme
MDRQIGAILNQLVEDGLLEKTIIFFYGDHGGPLPRQKRLIYDSGLNAPMIIRFPQQKNAGTRDGQLISFIDLAPAVLSLAEIQLPGYLHGRAFLGPAKSPQRRQYIHAAADRFDGFTDVIRAVRDERYKYIRNYRPEQGYYLPVTYREQIPTMQELLKMHDKGELNEIQEQWFRNEKPREELFDCLNDPHELVNLAADPTYKDKLAELSNEIDRWLQEIGDHPNLPEKQLVKQLWNNSDEQPTTDLPRINFNQGQLSLACDTPGASIGLKVWKEGETEPQSWSVYTNSISQPPGFQIKAIAHRIGYKPSVIINEEFN